MKLADRVAIVTGAGQGIGRGIALELARRGAIVAVTDINPTTAAAVADEIRALGREALAITMDVTSSADVNAGVKTVLDAFGRIDILVNNAGWDKIEPFVRSSEETWDKIIAINLKGQLNCARAVLDSMIAQGSGKIIGISSDAGRGGSSGEAVYSACKGGVIAFTKTLAREMCRYKINVNCVCPGLTDTPLYQGFHDSNPKLMDAVARGIPWGRLGTPEDIAKAVAFLASDDAEFITGQTLSVSGGLTMM